MTALAAHLAEDQIADSARAAVKAAKDALSSAVEGISSSAVEGISSSAVAATEAP